MTTRALPNLALSFENLTFSNFSSKAAWAQKPLATASFKQAILEKNFGHQLAENELQQNLSQDQQQLQDNQLAQKSFQQLNLAQHSFTEKNLHNKLATNFWNKAFQKNFLASKELAEKNFPGQAACRQQLYQDSPRSLHRRASHSLLTRSK